MFAIKKKKINPINALFDVFANISDLVFIMNVDEKGLFRYAFVNEPAKEIIGKQEDLIGKTIDEVLPLDDAKVIIEQYNYAVQNKECIIYEDCIKQNTSCTLNEVVCYESKITPFFDYQGNCTHIIAIVRDISDRKRKEIELHALKDRYQSLFEHNFNGVLSIDLNGNISAVNQSVEKLTGYSKCELIGISLTACIVSSYVEITEDAFQKTANGDAQKFESAIHHKDGHVVYLTVINVPIIIGTEIVGVYSIFIDQTERKKAEIALVESEERYRRLVEKSPNAIVVHRRGRILYANSRAQNSMLEQAPIGKSIYSYIHPDYRSISKEKFWYGKIGTEMPYMEIKMVRTDGEAIYAEIGGTMIPYNGKPAIMTIFRDVTERKLIERALKDSEENYRLIANKLSYMAYHDTLTNLPNRRLFIERLEQSILDADQFGKEIAVLYMDLDHFKTINDRLGHDVGDELLIQFSKRVKACLRKSDTLARLGGDEFCALVEINEVKDVIVVAQKIIHALQNKWNIGKYKIDTTSSIGIAIYEDGFTSKSLIKAADIALYEAKEKGRNNYQIYAR